VTSTDQNLARFHEEGFVILRDVIDSNEIDALRDALQPYLDLDLHGRNNFEGERTQRVYSLVGRGGVFERTAEHPAVLDLMDSLLQPGYLLTASQAICIHPGETVQPLHYDDTFYRLPRPTTPIPTFRSTRPSPRRSLQSRCRRDRWSYSRARCFTVAVPTAPPQPGVRSATNIVSPGLVSKKIS
jgi:hypothetical protein